MNIIGEDYVVNLKIDDIEIVPLSNRGFYVLLPEAEDGEYKMSNIYGVERTLDRVNASIYITLQVLKYTEINEYDLYELLNNYADQLCSEKVSDLLYFREDN